MKSFWQLDKKWNKMLIAFEESGGELTDELNETLAINRSDLDVCIDDQLSVLTYLYDDIERFKLEKQRLDEQIKNNEKLIKRIRAGLAEATKKYGQEGKLKSNNRSFSIKKTKIIEVVNTSHIPSEYLTYTMKTSMSRETKMKLIQLLGRFNPEFDETVKKKELKEAFDQGKVIDLGFKIIDNESVVIR